MTITGSTPAGRAVAAKAGAELKKSVLELGGSDAYVVLEDADVDAAAEICAASRLINGGQSCIAAKRFVVVEPVRERFEERLVERMQARRMGDPLDPATAVGPQARRDLRDELDRQVKASLARGARRAARLRRARRAGRLLPAERPERRHARHAGVRRGAVRAGRGRDRAPGTRRTRSGSPTTRVFGLGAAVFTADRARGERIARHELEAGSCFVNAFVRSDPRLPFGGIKQSGYGRELGAFGIREFVNVKTVYVAWDGGSGLVLHVVPGWRRTQ